MAAILRPCCSSVNGKVQCFEPEGLPKRDRNKLVDIWRQNLKYDYRKECSDSSQSLKDISLLLKLGNVDAGESNFVCKENGVQVDEGHVKHNCGVLGFGESRSYQGSGFTLQGMGECSRETITSLGESQQHEKNDVRVIEHPNLSDECKRELDYFLGESERLPPWGSGAISQDNYCKSEESLHDSAPATLNACTTDEINSRSLVKQGDEASLSRMLLNLSRANKVTSAWQLYRRMEKSGLKPTLHACNSLIAAFLRKGTIGDAFNVFESMKKMTEPSEHTYSLVIKAIAQSRGCELALCMLKEMETRDNLKLDIIVYNTLISVCRKEHKWDKVHELWVKLKKEGCKETMVTYRLLVSTFVQCDQVELALEAYRDMIENSWQPDGDVLKGLTCVCAKEGQWVLALDFFQQMVDLGLKPNKITYNALINSLGKAGEVDLAFKIYEHMQTVGHSADVYTSHALLNGLNKTGQFARSLSLFQYMKTSGNFEVDTEIYNVALVSCQRLGLWEKALQYIWEMEKSGIKPGTLSYNLLISTCEVAGQPKVALQIYEHMLTVNCTPNTFTYLPLIRACGRGLLWHDVKHVINLMTEDLLRDLVLYKKSHEKAVSSAARSLIALFRQICPLLLEKKDRGRAADTKARPKAFGEKIVATDVPGAALLLADDGASNDSDSDNEDAADADTLDLSSDMDSDDMSEESENERTGDESDDASENTRVDFDADDEEAACEEDGGYTECNEMVGASDEGLSSEEEIGSDEEKEDVHLQSKSKKRKISEVIDTVKDMSQQSIRALKKLAADKAVTSSLVTSEGVVDGILSNEDFQHIRELQAKRAAKAALAEHGMVKSGPVASAVPLKIPSSEQLCQQRVNPSKLIANIHTRKDKEERLALVKAGREDRVKYASRTAVKQKKSGGLSNRQKERHKAMPLAARRAKITRSHREKKKKRNTAKQFVGKKAWK